MVPAREAPGMRCAEKRWYLTKADARREAARLHQHGHPKNRAYRCTECGYWHLSSADAEERSVIRARIRADRGAA